MNSSDTWLKSYWPLVVWPLACDNGQLDLHLFIMEPGEYDLCAVKQELQPTLIGRVFIMQVEEKRRHAALTRRVWLYGALAIAAFVIGSLNLMVLLSAFWRPRLLLLSPLLMMFTAVGFWACASFLRTRSRLLCLRDESDEIEAKP